MSRTAFPVRPALGLLLALAIVPGPAVARAAPGLVMSATSLPGLAGGTEEILPRGAKAAVLLFFRTGQERSRDAVREFAVARDALAGKPVRFLGVVPEGTPAAEVRSLLDFAKVDFPVAVDPGDAAYAQLKLAMHPVAIVLGPGRTLEASESYRIGRFSAVLAARAKLALGEATEADVARADAPEPSPLPGDDPVQVSMRHVHLGQMLLKSRLPQKARVEAQQALAIAPSAAAWSLMGDTFAAERNCASAANAYKTALKLDPRDPAALAGRAKCPF